MAGFCRNCGSPLGDGQAFCVKCGTRIGEAAPPPAQVAGAPRPAGPAAAPPPAAMPAAAAPVATAPAPAKGSPLVKILLIVVAVIFLMGAVGIAGMMYVGYRIREKARQMGLTERALHHEPTLRGVNGCQWLPNEDVSQAIGMTVVRAEAQTGDSPGCTYSVAGDVNDLTMKHVMQLNKQQNTTMSKQDQQAMENFGKTMLRGSGGSSGDNTAHSGEVPVIVFTVDENAAEFQMRLNKGMLSKLGPMATKNVPNLGDEAFEMGGSMLMVRKGDKLLRMMYMQCPCGSEEILPLAQKLVGNL
jgi:zinc-ribbon domain